MATRACSHSRQWCAQAAAWQAAGWAGTNTHPPTPGGCPSGQVQTTHSAHPLTHPPASLFPFDPAEVEKKFAASAWGQKLAKRQAKAAQNDFDRYKAMVQKVKRSAQVRAGWAVHCRVQWAWAQQWDGWEGVSVCCGQDAEGQAQRPGAIDACAVRQQQQQQ